MTEIAGSRNLTKVYSGKVKVKALDEFSISVQPGQIFGLLGQNGAGKTTFIKILLGIISHTSGSYSLFGSDHPEHLVKKRIGYLPENVSFPEVFTAQQNMEAFAGFYRMDRELTRKRTGELFEMLGLSKIANRRTKTFSKGQNQRLGLARALLHDPDLIILDEPTDGIDPVGRKEIRTILQDLRSRGKTIFLNSHILSEVEMVTDSVAILHKGKLLRTGSIDELTSENSGYELKLSRGLTLQEENSIVYLEKTGENVYRYNGSDIEGLNRMIDKVRILDVLIHEIALKKSNLEDLFIKTISSDEGGKR
ncbi:MAG: ABC transporter ATP-binding protein [Ignavibacteriaceae bacterium]|nr:MAG: ABC transporter ATP-binding protein [Chlorobiota bacterium]GJQ32023.1 MAG: ABC transporter ATP-binding protein [Ignavibacteriaceae bacterium]